MRPKEASTNKPHAASHGCGGRGGGITHMKFEWFEAAKRGRAKKLNHMKLRMVVAAKGGEK